MCHKLFMVCSILGCVLFIPGGALFIPRGCLIHPHPALIIPRVGLNWSPGMNRSLYLTLHEGGARASNPSGCQPSIREAVLGHRRDVTLRYGWIWGLGSWTLCLSPADWVQYAQGAMD